jgi:hypothetical protein
VEILKDLGSLQHSLDYLDQLHLNLKKELDKFGGNPILEADFDATMNSLKKRSI